MCFNAFYGNKDDHEKNIAFIYDESINGYKLSPQYDTTKVNKLEYEMTFLGNGNPKEEDLINIAKKFLIEKSDYEFILNNIKTILKIKDSNLL